MKKYEYRKMLGKSEFNSLWEELEKTCNRILDYDAAAERIFLTILKSGLPQCKIHQPNIGVENKSHVSLLYQLLKHFEFKDEQYEKCKQLISGKSSQTPPKASFIYDSVTVLSMQNNTEVLWFVIRQYGMFAFSEADQTLADTTVDGIALTRRLMEFCQRQGEDKRQSYWEDLMNELIKERYGLLD